MIWNTHLYKFTHKIHINVEGRLKTLHMEVEKEQMKAERKKNDKMEPKLKGTPQTRPSASL